MNPKREPRPLRKLSETLAGPLREMAPQTLLAEVQAAWPAVCGPLIAANAEPVGERQGRVTIACSAGAWAQELELMSDALLDRIGAEIGADRVVSLRFTADLGRHR